MAGERQIARISGPAQFLELCSSNGLAVEGVDAFGNEAAATLAFSPFSEVNLPPEDRAIARIPQDAAFFAFVYPSLAASRLGAAQSAGLLGSTRGQLLLNGGYAYVDGAGKLLSINAIDPSV